MKMFPSRPGLLTFLCLTALSALHGKALAGEPVVDQRGPHLEKGRPFYARLEARTSQTINGVAYHMTRKQTFRMIGRELLAASNGLAYSARDHSAKQGENHEHGGT